MSIKPSDIIRLGHKSNSGLTEFAVTLTITHCTTAQLTTLITSAETTSNTYLASKSAKTQAYIDLRTARAAAILFLENVREFLKPRLGAEWNGLWNIVGFTGPLLAVPREDEDVLAMLRAVKAYFLPDATLESAAYQLTALKAEERITALTAAMTTANNCREDQRAKREARDAAVAALLKKLRSLWTELASVLEPLDTRWLKFIDRIPGDPRVPAAVEDVSAAAQPGGIITLDWEDTERAARYKVLKQVVGVDADLVLFTTVDDSDAQVTGLPVGATVNLQIVATNSVGDAPASGVIQLQAA